MIKSVLFLCTGNYYRSRAAEALFNAEMRRLRASWRAFSMGLALKPNPANVGPISPFTLEALRSWKVADPSVERFPRFVTPEDFESYHIVIAVSEREHRPMIEARFPLHADQVQYFDIEDVAVLSPERAMPALKDEVEAFIKSLLEDE